jgi:hypothetical protein
MAYSYIEYTADGSTTTFSVPFDYTAQADVKVFVGGVEDTSFTFNSNSVVQTSTTPASGVVVRVERNTDLDSRAVDFASGSVLTEEDLDNSNIQVYFAAQEAIDTAESALIQTPDGKWDAQSRVIKNVTDPTNAQDAVTKNYLENTWLTLSDKAQLNALNTDNLNRVHTSIDELDRVHTSIDNLDRVHTSIGNIDRVDQSIDNVDRVHTSIANIDRVEDSIANVDRVATSADNLDRVHTSIGNVDRVDQSIDNVDRVATSADNLDRVHTSIGKLDRVHTSISAVDTVAADLNEPTSEIETVANSIANVNNVGNDIASVTQVSTDIADVRQVATDTVALNSVYNNIGAVSNVSTNMSAVTNVNTNMAVVTNVSNNMADIQAVEAEVAKVVAVANDLAEATSEIDVVAGSIANVDLVGGSIANVNEVAANLADVNNFADTYSVGATAPVSPTTGDLWFDSSASTMKVYDGTGFVNAGSSVSGVAESVEYVATAGQTSFSATYDAGAVDVYLNGVLLAATDYTATDGSNIVLATGASAGDIVYIQAFGTFALADHYTKTASDARYLPIDAVTLPDQTNNDGKYLTTDGTDASWATLDTDANTTTKGLYEHSNAISADYSITVGNNAMSSGVMTIASGVTVTIPSGSSWTIV